MYPLTSQSAKTHSLFSTLNFTRLRKRMVENQLYPNHISNPKIIEVFQAVPRENFLPSNLRPIAYSDTLLEVLPGRYMLPPLLLGKLIQALNPQDFDSTLVVGDITGYTAAILSGLSGGVVSLLPNTLSKEYIQSLKETLDAYSPNPVILKQDSLEKGAPLYAPYTHLFFEGALPYFPKNLLDSLTTQGSAIAMIWKNSFYSEATLYKKNNLISSNHVLFEGFFPLLPEFRPIPPFSF